MSVLIIGATGIIGSAVLGRLRANGREVVATARTKGPAADRLQAHRTIHLDLAETTKPEDWLPHLEGVETVVNCAGVLQDSPRDSTAGVHLTGASALYDACERAGVRRIIHLSAIGVDRTALTSFSQTKLAGEQSLMSRDLDWVVLRPSVVLGRPAYGGSALFRGLASLPVLPLAPDTGPLQVVWLDDLVDTILFFTRPDAPARVALEVAGPERLTFEQVVRTFREWLGWRPAPSFTLPGWAAKAMYLTGDLLGRLGWRPAMRTNARLEITQGAIGDPARWTRITGIEPRPLRAALMSEPASVQERWFSQLYFLKPVVLGVFSLFWILTGVVSLGPGYGIGIALMQEGGAGALSAPSVIAGALADLAIGVGIAFRKWARPALYAAIAITVFYIVAGTLLLPRLWAEPLGPMMKVWPILALNLVALAILEDR